MVVIEGSLKKSKSGIVVASKAQAWGEEYLLESAKNKMLVNCFKLKVGRRYCDGVGRGYRGNYD